MSGDYIKINKALWNSRVQPHFDSEFYRMNDFLNGWNSLKNIELELLGDVRGKSILHLQCHFGQDSLSLQRMGAQVTGVDFSENAIAKAREMNDTLSLGARFICEDIFKLNSALDEQFDIVFTSYGTIGWLPELETWGKMISFFLKPGGMFVFAEFHPVLWIFDDEFKNIVFEYSNSGPIIEEFTGSYADRESDLPAKSCCWNHSLAEVFSALIGSGIAIHKFNEYNYSPYNIFPKSVAVEHGFQVKGLENKIPITYSILGEKQKGVE